MAGDSRPSRFSPSSPPRRTERCFDQGISQLARLAGHHQSAGDAVHDVLAHAAEGRGDYR